MLNTVFKSFIIASFAFSLFGSQKNHEIRFYKDFKAAIYSEHVPDKKSKSKHEYKSIGQHLEKDEKAVQILLNYKKATKSKEVQSLLKTLQKEYTGSGTIMPVLVRSQTGKNWGEKFYGLYLSRFSKDLKSQPYPFRFHEKNNARLHLQQQNLQAGIEGYSKLEEDSPLLSEANIKEQMIKVLKENIELNRKMQEAVAIDKAIKEAKEKTRNEVLDGLLDPSHHHRYQEEIKISDSLSRSDSDLQENLKVSYDDKNKESSSLKK